MSLPYGQSYPLLGASGTAITVSTGNGVPADKQKLSVQFTASGISSGNGVFSIQVSNDGVNWITYNRLNDNVTNTNAQFDTRVASCTLSTNTSKMYFFPEGDYFKMVRCLVTVTTDGTYSATLFVG